MRNAMVRSELRRDFNGSVERADGLRPEGLRTGASRAAQMLIADSTRLPVISDMTPLQRSSDGKFYFIVGYSAVGGPDVPGP